MKTAAYALMFCAAKTGDVNELKRLYQQNKNFSSSQFLAQAARHGHLECVKFLVSKCSNGEVYNFGLIPAIRNSQQECTQYLLSFFTQPFDCSTALDTAVITGNIELVKHFIPLGDQKCGSLALGSAVRKGNKELFDLLLPVSAPKKYDSLALFCAVEENQTEFFDILLPLSNPNADNGVAFRKAVELGYTHFAEILYPLVDVQKIMKYVSDFKPTSYGKLYSDICALEAKMQKDVLNENLQDQQMSKNVSRKI